MTWSTPWVTFVGGTLVSTSAGILAGVLLQETGSGVIVGLVAQAIAVMLALWARVAEAEHRLGQQLEGSSAFLRLVRNIAELNEPVINKRFRLLQEEIRELTEGRYRLRSLEAVYDDDVMSVALLNEGDHLRSICPVAREEAAITEQLRNNSFKLSMDGHLEAAKRGVIADRVYIFVERAHYNLPVVQEHLNALVKGDLKCYYAIRDEPKFQRVRLMDSDFIVFGDRKVSVGDISPSTGMVRGANVYSDADTVARFQEEFDMLKAVSEEHRLEQVPDGASAPTSR